MRLDVVELHALDVEEGLERADLVDQAVRQLLAAHLHLAPAEALQVGQRRVGADLHAMRLGQADGLAHHAGIRAVKAAGHIGHGDVGHDALVVAQLIEAEALAHVAIDCQSHIVFLSLVVEVSGGALPIVRHPGECRDPRRRCPESDGEQRASIPTCQPAARWIPAFVGMTGKGPKPSFSVHPPPQSRSWAMKRWRSWSAMTAAISRTPITTVCR